ncbi:DUF1878 family protein [Virgibacillus dakarensis]|uniref:DUF1878 domain-containing protein n=1 Tax=Lentibacillus populi TaxID=1827502 RepID=A0A9W5TZJ6_9BACI|nr:MULTISPECIES: DUF1878 family protein [Bacillaceae]MBT2215324.1 DUF1878 family protein [Virgibacillus dakarensis]MTW85508.1 DUF1878 family protein [Virgibacillus dakarensis]GGB51570.1 hypothetical protein GCM10011409_31410 [Lentibacillus populi]
MDELKNDDTIHFHLQLLSKLIDIKQYPFIKLIIEHNITFQEYNNLFLLLDKLNEQYESQKEEGFLDFTSLLVHFGGMLTEKLDPNDTIFALKREGYFPSLMGEFIKIIERK